MTVELHENITKSLYDRTSIYYTTHFPRTFSGLDGKIYVANFKHSTFLRCQFFSQQNKKKPSKQRLTMLTSMLRQV